MKERGAKLVKSWDQIKELVFKCRVTKRDALERRVKSPKWAIVDASVSEKLVIKYDGIDQI